MSVITINNDSEFPKRSHIFSNTLRDISNFFFDLLLKLVSIPMFLVGTICTWIGIIRTINQKKLRELEGKTVLITGANSGIGECLAKYFYLSGCKVILAARRRNELERVQRELMNLKSDRDVILHPPSILEMDVSNWKAIPEKVQTVLQTHNVIDILINNAGIFNQGTCLKTRMEVDEQVMNVNYMGTLALTKCVGNLMAERHSGHIVFVSSVLGKMAIGNSSSYIASKHAMQALADCFRLEVRRHGVKTTILSPGYVKTPIAINTLTPTGEKLGEQMNEIENGYDLDYACEQMFKAVVNEEDDVIIAPWYIRASIVLRTFWPKMYFFSVDVYNRRFNLE